MTPTSSSPEPTRNQQAQTPRSEHVSIGSGPGTSSRKPGLQRGGGGYADRPREREPVPVPTPIGNRNRLPECELTPLERALAAVTQAADDLAARYPSADYSGTSRRRAKRDSEWAARRANR